MNTQTEESKKAQEAFIETEKSKFRTTRAFADDGGDTITEKKRISSPSRRYVAICNTGNWDGHYFKSFTLPAEAFDNADNHTDNAAWYFLNRLDSYACIDKCVTEEDFYNLTEAKEVMEWFHPSSGHGKILMVTGEKILTSSE